MLHFIAYHWVKYSLRLSFPLFYREYKIFGSENFPKGKPVILLPNHQNAFMDALLSGASSNGINHFMTRGDIFGNPFFTWLMGLVNMHPIYRMRDGKEALGKNKAVFDACYTYLKNGHYIMIHPEANHNPKYQLRPISKGFTRIVFGALDKYPEMDLQLLPIGFNYSDHHKYRSRASIYFGKPIAAKDYYTQENGAILLKDEVEKQMQKLIVHIPSIENYDSTKKQLEAIHADFANPIETNALIKAIENGETPEKLKDKRPPVNFFEKTLYPFVYLNNLVYILLWKSISKKIKDPGFAISIKFAIGTFVLPYIYFLQTYLVYLFSEENIWVSLIYFILTIMSTPILAIKQGKKWGKPH